MTYVWHRITHLICIGSLLVFAPVHTDIYDDFLQEQSSIDAMNDSFSDELDLYDECFVGTNTLKQLPPEVIIQLLLQFNALTILQTDFYLQTNPLNKRSLLDSPLFEYQVFDSIKPSQFNAYLFFNKTNRYNFTATSDNISCYLNLASPTLIGAIVSAIESINSAAPSFANFDVSTVFEIFQKTRLEERNFGLMLTYAYTWKRAYFYMMTPFFYHERNFFLTMDELDELADQLGEAEPDFQKEHVISDKLGFGDTRIELGIHVVEKPSIECVLGFQATLPTAFIVAKNFFGSSFPAQNSYPEIDFNTIYIALEKYLTHTITLREQNEVIAIARTFILSAIDRLAANLIDDPLGNGGHFGTGLFAYTHSPICCICDREWTENWWWDNRISFEFLWSKDQNLSYIHKNNPENFSSRNFDDPNQATDNLIFLQNELIYRTNLLALKTNVLPGLIFRWTSALDYEGLCWSTRLGANLWIQNGQTRGNPMVPPCNSTTTQSLIAQLDLCKVQTPLACQLKIFGDLAYTFEHKQTTWTIGINGDITALKRGIGRDYTIGLIFEASF